ncbi:MAG: protein kinase domain-containing protein [Blastocatellia bacterium]
MDTRLKRKVAIKLLPEKFATDPERLRRFETEAKAASATDHPNIVTIHEIGESNGTYYIAQEYVEGETLRSRIERGPIPLLDTLDIAHQTANALAAAHGAGIVHRDIKPENIMLRHDGFVKVLDFGLAGILQTESNSENLSDAKTLLKNTAPGVILGTVNYMSPEQTRGQKLDARSDLWSLGVVLYEMLTGQRPFHGESMPDIFVAILERQPAPLTESLADPPKQLQQILDKLLTKNRDQRYQSSAQLAAELKRFHHRLELDAERESGEVSESATLFFKHPVQTAERQAAASTRNEQVHATEPTSLRPTPVSAGVFRQVQNHKVLSSVITLFFLALFSSAAYFFLRPSVGNPAIDSIAVLPFQNLTGDKDLAYLSDGLSQGLIDRLSELPQLKVISRNSSFKFRGENLDLQSIATQLGVRAIVTGSVAQINGELVIRFGLEDTANNRQIISRQYQPKAGSILRIQNEIAQAASQQLLLKLTASESERLTQSDTKNSDAYRYYLNGLVELNNDPTDIKGKALAYFEKAITLDPRFAAAYVEIAWIYWYQANGNDNPHELMPKAKAMTARALEIDHTLAKAHVLLATVKEYEFDWRGAEEEYLRAIELSPNLDTAHNSYAFFLSVMGRHDAALAELEQQRIRDPINQRLTLLQKGAILSAEKKFDEALQSYQDLRDLEPDNDVPPIALGYAYAGKGLYPKAAEYYRKAVALSGGEEKYSQPLVYLAATYAQIPEKRGEARAILKRIETTSGYASPALLAVLYSALGDNDKAIEMLERAFTERDLLLRYIGTGYEYEKLHSDPRFISLTKRIGLSQ